MIRITFRVYNFNFGAAHDAGIQGLRMERKLRNSLETSNMFGLWKACPGKNISLTENTNISDPSPLTRHRTGKYFGRNR